MGSGESELSEQLVEAIDDAVGGPYEGHRAAHAKGVLCAGTFTAGPDAARLSTAAHLQGEPVRAHVRFSNGSGKPTTRDGTRDERGMATKFYLPDGSTTDIVGITLPAFFVRNVEDFLEFTRARRPDPETGQPDMERLGAFFGAHPEVQTAVQHHLSAPPPESYARLGYNSLHAFAFTAPDGERRFVRYHWEPELGRGSISEEEAAAAAPEYLADELRERLAKGSVGFRLEVAIAAEGDPTDDPTAVWPEDREVVELGRLEITGTADDRDRDGDVLVFDPTRVTDGNACSEDPILLARPGAYAVSVHRRSGAVREGTPAG